MNKKNKIWWAVAGIIIAVCVWIFFVPKKAKPPQYKTVKVERGDIISMISATGTVNVVTSVDVGSQVSGIIQDLFADYNSIVKKGQVIAQIDPSSVKSKLDQAEANLMKAKIAVADAKRTLDRNTELFSKNLIAQSEKDSSQTAYDNALISLKQAQASYDLAMTDLKNTTIVSPIDGIVISRNVNAGQTVAASFSAPTLFTIARGLAEMQIEANIDEGDIGKVKNGQQVVFTVDAFPDENFSGKVSQVRLAPEIVQRVVTYIVIIKVRNDKLLLKPGMTANTNIITDRSNNVLKVANAALRFKPAETAQQLAKKNDNKAKLPQTAGETNTGRRRGGNTGTGMPNRPKRSKSTMQSVENFSTIWILEGKSLKPVKVKTGITDGIATEIGAPEISDGSEVVVGLNGKTSATPQATPFGMMGGGRH